MSVLPSPPSFKKVNPADQPVYIFGLNSDAHTLSALDDYAETVIAPRLSEFATQFPQIDMEIMFTDQRLEFIESNVDLALWTGPLPESRP